MAATLQPRSPRTVLQTDANELATLFAAAYLRLLASRVNDSSRLNRLDSPEQKSDELPMTTTRRRHRA